MTTPEGHPANADKVREIQPVQLDYQRDLTDFRPIAVPTDQQLIVTGAEEVVKPDPKLLSVPAHVDSPESPPPTGEPEEEPPVPNPAAEGNIPPSPQKTGSQTSSAQPTTPGKPKQLAVTTPPNSSSPSAATGTSPTKPE